MTRYNLLKNSYNGPEALSTFFLISVLFLILLSGTGQAQTQYFPSNLLANFPNAEEKLLSEDVNVRVSVLDELLVPVPRSCTGEQKLPFNLERSDYAFVLEKIFEKDLSSLDEKSSSQVWGKISFLILRFEFKAFASVISRYLKEPNWRTQTTVTNVIRELDAREFDAELAPLLNSDQKYLREEVLRTLIRFESHKAVPALVTLLYDEDHLKRFYALQSLVKVRGRSASFHIARALQDQSEDNRYWALDALVKLKAKERVTDIWSLINSGQRPQTETYAVAALVYFEDPKAIPLAVSEITGTRKGDGTILERLTNLNARQIIPALIAILDQPPADTPKWGRSDIVYALGKLGVRESSGTLRKYIAQFPMSRRPVIQVLGEFEDKDSVNDLLDIFYKYLPDPPNNITNDTYESAEAAVALAKIGDPKTWKALIDAAENPRFPYRGQVIQELNRHVDTSLWKKVMQAKVKGVDYKPINTNTDIFTLEGGIPIDLEFEPGRDLSKTQPLEKEKFPWMRAGLEMPLLTGLREIISMIDAGTLPSTFTFVFDRGRIRILSVEKAIRWWRDNKLVGEK